MSQSADFQVKKTGEVERVTPESITPAKAAEMKTYDEKLMEMDPPTRALEIVKRLPILIEKSNETLKPLQNRATALTMNNTATNRKAVIRGLRNLRVQNREITMFFQLLFLWFKEQNEHMQLNMEQICTKLQTAVAAKTSFEVLDEDREEFWKEFQKRCKNSTNVTTKNFMNNKELVFAKAQDSLMFMAQGDDSDTIPEHFFDTYDLIEIRKMAKEMARKKATAEQEEQNKALVEAAKLAQEAAATTTIKG